MSSTSEALVQLAEQKEALRIIANRYLDNADKLPVNCTLQDIIDVLNEYDEYSYMNAFLNSIEVFPDKDYSINDTAGHIKGLRPSVFYENTALRSVLLSGITSVTSASGAPNPQFYRCTNLKYVLLPNVLNFDYNNAFQYCGNFNLSIPKATYFWSNTAFSYSSINSLIIGCGLVNNAYGLDIAATKNSFRALICVNQSSISTLGGSTIVNTLLACPNEENYVPSALLSDYQTYTNWSTIHASRPILDIESHINYLRDDLGVDFSYTPYANKRWDTTLTPPALVTDSTIGEEVDE